jgi:deoxyribodipyrimidine photo-lyase
LCFRSNPGRQPHSSETGGAEGTGGQDKAKILPIVDAGMRELRRTGWMHNRVRMVVASFLDKDLLLPWQEGSRWFLETLTDADLANNTFGRQWMAGCGADAAPFFRIFNPVIRRKRYGTREFESE